MNHGLHLDKKYYIPGLTKRRMEERDHYERIIEMFEEFVSRQALEEEEMCIEIGGELLGEIEEESFTYGDVVAALNWFAYDKNHPKLQR